MRGAIVTAKFLSGSGCCQMLTRYLPLWCRHISRRSSRGGLPILANTWDLIRSVWFGTAAVSSLFGEVFFVFFIIAWLVKGDDSDHRTLYTIFCPVWAGACPPSNPGTLIGRFKAAFSLPPSRKTVRIAAEQAPRPHIGC
jgi:hypothetical protein